MAAPSLRLLLAWSIVAAIAFCWSQQAVSQGFAALVAPPRFELKAKPGGRVRDVFELTNGGQQPARYRFRTADWTLGPDGQVITFDELQPSSCRPWVAIERPMAEVQPGGRMRYRFEVNPPADAKSGECRFALLVEGDEAAVASGEGFRMPVKGRIAVIVYLAIGDASPRLEVEKAAAIEQKGQKVAVLFVRNTGNAHGRLGGFLSGTDAQGRKLDFAPASLPILPGEIRTIALTANDERDQPVRPAFPVAIRGTLEWAGGRLPFEHRFE